MSENSLAGPLDAATQRLIRTVDGFDEDDLRAPSLLPSWSRAHVVAHLALNAEAFARVFRGLVSGSPVAMYDSAEARDDDIDSLAEEAPATLRERLLASSTDFTDAALHLTDEQRLAPILRTPAGPTMAAGDPLDKRMREVEIHHADLGVGYTHADWPQSFSLSLIEGMRGRSSWDDAFVARATDVGGEWRFGAASPSVPVVSGQASALAWWLTGRGDGAGLTSSTGSLPAMASW